MSISFPLPIFSARGAPYLSVSGTHFLSSIEGVQTKRQQTMAGRVVVQYDYVVLSKKDKASNLENSSNNKQPAKKAVVRCMTQSAAMLKPRQLSVSVWQATTTRFTVLHYPLHLKTYHRRR